MKPADLMRGGLAVVLLLGGVVVSAAGAAEEGDEAPRGNYSRLWQILNSGDLKSFRENLQAVLPGPADLMPEFTPTAPPQAFFELPVVLSPAEPAEPRQPAVAVGTENRALYGRRGEVRVVEKDGRVRVFTPRELAFVNQPGFRLSDLPPKPARYGVPQVAFLPGETGESEAETPEEESGAPVEAEEETAEGETERSEEAADDSTAEGPAEDEDQPAEPVAKQEAKQEKTPRQLAAETRAAKAKDADVEQLRALRQDGAWFYNADGSSITSDELDARFASGDIEDIKTVTRYHQAWTTKANYEPEVIEP